MGKILSLKYCTASGNDNWKENPPKYHFSQRAVLSLTGFGTITDINGTVVIVDVDINEVFFEHLLATSASCETRTPNIILSQTANIFWCGGSFVSDKLHFFSLLFPLRGFQTNDYIIWRLIISCKIRLENDRLNRLVTCSLQPVSLPFPFGIFCILILYSFLLW